MQQKYMPLPQTSPKQMRPDIQVHAPPTPRQAQPRIASTLVGEEGALALDGDDNDCVRDRGREQRGHNNVFQARHFHNHYDDPVDHGRAYFGDRVQDHVGDYVQDYAQDRTHQDAHIKGTQLHEDLVGREEHQRARKPHSASSRSCSTCLFSVIRSAVVLVPELARLGAKMVGAGSGFVARAAVEESSTAARTASFKRGEDVGSGVGDADDESVGSREEDGGVRLLSDGVVADVAAAAATDAASRASASTSAAFDFMDRSGDGFFEEEMDIDEQGFGFRKPLPSKSSLRMASIVEKENRASKTIHSSLPPTTTTSAYKVPPRKTSRFFPDTAADSSIMDTDTENIAAPITTPTRPSTPATSIRAYKPFSSLITDTSTADDAFMETSDTEDEGATPTHAAVRPTPATAATATSTTVPETCVFMDIALNPSRPSTPTPSDSAYDYLFSESPGPSVHDQEIENQEEEGKKEEGDTAAVETPKALHRGISTGTKTNTVTGSSYNNNETMTKSTSSTPTPTPSPALSQPSPFATRANNQTRDRAQQKSEKSTAAIARETAREFSRLVQRGKVMAPTREDAMRFREWVRAYYARR